MKRLFVLVFLLPVTLQAQTRALSGKVTDGSGAVIVGATVNIYERDGRERVTATTRNDGTYLFENLTAGEHLAEVIAQGFAPATKIIRFGEPESLEPRALDFSLGVAGVQEQVIVTASGTAQSVDELSKALTVITSQQIEQRDEYLIADALRTTPGMRVIQLGGPGQFTRLSVRGLRPNDTALTIDGLRFRDAADTDYGAGPTTFLSDLQLVNNDRVEVLRGSGSALYGSNATGAVINVITGQGSGPLRSTLQAEGGGLGFTRVLANFSGGALHDKLFYSAGANNMRVFGGLDGHDDTRNTGGQGQVGYNFTPLISLTGRFYGSNGYAYTNTSPSVAPGLPPVPPGTLIPAIALPLDVQRMLEQRGIPLNATNYTRGNATFIPDLDDPDSRRNSHYTSGALTFSHRFNQQASYRVSYQRVSTSRRYLQGPLGIGGVQPKFTTDSSYNGTVDTFNSHGDFGIGSHQTLSAGYEYEREGYENPRTDQNPDLTKRVNAFTAIGLRSHSFFVQDQTRLAADRLQLSTAFRTQGFQLTQPVFQGAPSRYQNVSLTNPRRAYTGDVSIAWFFRSSGTKIRAHGGNTYRAPSAFERFGSGYSTGAFTPYGDPQLRPERAIAVDAGLDQSLLKNRVRLGATYFYTRLQEVIQFVSLPSTDPYQRVAGGYANIGGGLARGVELTAEVSPTRTLTVSGAYTYTNAILKTTTRPGLLIIPGTSKDLFTFFVNQNIRRRWDVTFDFWGASEYSPSFPTPSATSLFLVTGPKKGDLGVSYTLPVTDKRNVRFYTKIQNVFNNTYFEQCYRSPGIWAIAGMAVKF
jgi:vitamin B12 transporter